MSSEDARSAWRAVAAREGLEAQAEALFEHAVPCALVAKRTAGAGGRGSSRIGGCPDLPPSVAWPVDDGEHLTFVAQVDLSALEPWCVPGFPARGWLWFFVGLDEPAWNVDHRVIHFDGARAELVEARPPAGTGAIAPERRGFAPITVEWEPSFEFDEDVEASLGLEEFTLENLQASHTQLAGLPVVWSRDARREAHMIKSGLEPILFETHETPGRMARKTKNAWASGDVERAEAAERAEAMLNEYLANRADHEAAAARWRTLMLLGSEREADMCWWDAGLLQFLVRDEDLRAGRFEDTYCCVASS